MKLSGAESVTCYGVLVDKNSTWKSHIKYIEKKIAKKYWIII